MWAIASVFGLVVARHCATQDALAFMRDFWGSRHSFLPLPPRPVSAVTWSWSRIAQFFDDRWMLDCALPAFFAFITIVDFVALCYRQRDIALMMAGPGRLEGLIPIQPFKQHRS
jgi:hypothetical protein